MSGVDQRQKMVEALIREERRCYIAGLKMEEGTMSQRYSGGPLKLERASKHSPLGPPGGMPACAHLDFSPVKLISDFWPSEL